PVATRRWPFTASPQSSPLQDVGNTGTAGVMGAVAFWFSGGRNNVGGSLMVLPVAQKRLSCTTRSVIWPPGLIVVQSDALLPVPSGACSTDAPVSASAIERLCFSRY